LTEEDTEKTREVIEALKQAGEELVKKGRISKNLLDVISQPLVSEEEYRRNWNTNYEKLKGKEKD